MKTDTDKDKRAAAPGRTAGAGADAGADAGRTTTTTPTRPAVPGRNRTGRRPRWTRTQYPVKLPAVPGMQETECIIKRVRVLNNKQQQKNPKTAGYIYVPPYWEGEIKARLEPEPNPENPQYITAKIQKGKTATATTHTRARLPAEWIGKTVMVYHTTAPAPADAGAGATPEAGNSSGKNPEQEQEQEQTQ